jgi:hypothetical protein
LVEVIDRAMAIEGLMARSEVELLYEFAQKMDDIVEIGSFKGRSTYALCSGCKGTVYSVDHFQMDGVDTYDEFMENTKEFSNLVVVRMASVEAAASTLIPPLVDMVFLDADHEYDGFKLDLDVWAHRARKLVCGHDFGHGFPGIERALTEFYGVGRVVAPQTIWWANR